MEIPKDIITSELLKNLFNRYEEMLLTKVSSLIDDITRNY